MKGYPKRVQGAAQDDTLRRGTLVKRGQSPAVTISLDQSNVELARSQVEERGFRDQTYIKRYCIRPLRKKPTGPTLSHRPKQSAGAATCRARTGNCRRGGSEMPEALQPTKVQVNITGRHTVEQLALEIQKAVAMVRAYGATRLEKFRFRLLPLDQKAAPMILRDGQERQMTVINLPEEPEQPVYREDERA